MCDFRLSRCELYTARVKYLKETQKNLKKTQEAKGEII